LRLAPNPPALATIVAYVRRPSGQMPPYTSRVISDQELANIYAFLRTIPAPPPTSSIPLLNQ
jgi:mono/diheme cytochrome c family protein